MYWVVNSGPESVERVWRPWSALALVWLLTSIAGKDKNEGGGGDIYMQMQHTRAPMQHMEIWSSTIKTFLMRLSNVRVYSRPRVVVDRSPSCSRARCRKRARGEGAALGSPPIPAERVYEPTRHCQGYLPAPFPFCAAAAGVRYRLRWRLYPRRQRCPHNFDWSLFSSLFFKLYGHSSPWFFLGCRPTYGYLFQAREDGKRLCWI